ncbi:hypothetical protein D932_02388 [Enterococcus casseliflavus 14-MB-W-14]|nr:hypothetical protein D932_02388 [Enterococcus casseliflavus 14-MB-W-14]
MTKEQNPRLLKNLLVELLSTKEGNNNKFPKKRIQEKTKNQLRLIS